MHKKTIWPSFRRRPFCFLTMCSLDWIRSGWNPAICFRYILNIILIKQQCLSSKFLYIVLYQICYIRSPHCILIWVCGWNIFTKRTDPFVWAEDELSQCQKWNFYSFPLSWFYRVDLTRVVRTNDSSGIQRLFIRSMILVGAHWKELWMLVML